MSQETSETLRVLKECFDVISTPSEEKFMEFKHFSSPRTVSSTGVSQHPDIQYFKSIKMKNHYNYHKYRNRSKGSGGESGKGRPFEPFSREFLLKRLATFTALNWSIPYYGEKFELNELKCARNGWKCVSIATNHNTKNHLLCTWCHSQLILKFNDIASATTYFPFEFDSEDYEELNRPLISQYMDSIVRSGHDGNCPWNHFECPLEGVYYLRPFMSQTHEILTADFLKNLKNLADNQLVLNRCFSGIIDEFSGWEGVDFDSLVEVSNNLLLEHYCLEDKENFISTIQFLPKLYYMIACLGWDLHIQSFADQAVLLLICSKCNSRIFLESESCGPISKTDQEELGKSGIALSNSRILTPCKFPPIVIPDGTKDFYDGSSGLDNGDSLEFGVNNLIEEHKHWCCSVKVIGDGKPLFQYFMELLVESAGFSDQMDSNDIADFSFDDVIPYSNKKRSNEEISQSLERFNKLRKLYIIED